MIVSFDKHYCECRQRETLHEVTTVPCCVICHEYKWGLPEKPIKLEVERFIDE